jgi:hypothetical protein
MHDKFRLEQKNAQPGCINYHFYESIILVSWYSVLSLTVLTEWSRVVLEMLLVAQRIYKSEPEGSLLSSEEPNTGPYFEQGESNS